MRALFIAISVLAAITIPVHPARADFLVPPVDGGVTRHFDAPASDYSAGHRGIDYSVARGTRVRAAGDGKVTFAGSVAGSPAITISHGGGLETTYSRLSEVWVEAGEPVEAGSWIGLAGDAHPGAPGLHLGAKIDGAYVDPTTLLGPLDASGALRLTPVLWEPSEAFGPELGSALTPDGPGDHRAACDPTPDAGGTAPPNDNVAIAVAGITSKTRGRQSADMYGSGLRHLGYRPGHTYKFSYKGSRGPHFHEPYDRTDTYGDIRTAARKLGAMVQKVSTKHPGRGIDLIAHSQGGVVARTYLTEFAEPFGKGRVENLVTFATPHGGAPVASTARDLGTKTVSGPVLLAGASKLARAGHPVPDPWGGAVGQLAPGSELMDSLASRDLVYGTRALTLGIPNDFVVPADRTGLYGGTHRIVEPSELFVRAGPVLLPGNGHSGIVTSEMARSYVRGFLAGRPAPCRTGWDDIGPRVGAAVSFVEGNLGKLVSLAEGFGGRLLASLAALFD